VFLLYFRHRCALSSGVSSAMHLKQNSQCFCCISGTAAHCLCWLRAAPVGGPLNRSQGGLVDLTVALILTVPTNPRGLSLRCVRCHAPKIKFSVFLLYFRHCCALLLLAASCPVGSPLNRSQGGLVDLTDALILTVPTNPRGLSLAGDDGVGASAENWLPRWQGRLPADCRPVAQGTGCVRVGTANATVAAFRSLKASQHIRLSRLMAQSDKSRGSGGWPPASLQRSPPVCVRFSISLNRPNSESRLTSTVAEGIDPGGEFLEFSRRHLQAQVLVNTLENLQGRARCDVVLLVHVIEHLRSPRAALQHISRLLGPGGLLYVECPNLQAPFARRHKLFHSAHIHNFVPATLQMLAEACGFELRHRFGDEQDPNLQMLFEFTGRCQLRIDEENFQRTIEQLSRADFVPYFFRCRYITDRIRKLCSYAAEYLFAGSFVRRLTRRFHAPDHRTPKRHPGTLSFLKTH
jgi:SAM-dependent methyltransferase